MAGKNDERISKLLEDIMNDRGVPRNIKSSIEESIKILNSKDPEEEKIATIISILDEASNDPNLSPHARTKIWNMVSVLESLKK
ncbi:MAG: UPF0147 family protein [Candidatus Aenigmatarchaeota archaeon]|nr:MAG: UPF0147 family protein [Candidatus Aenigmarchaeota archaeon]